MGRRRIPQSAVAEIGAERIGTLAALAGEAVREGRTDRARRYVDLARRVAGKCQIRMPEDFRYCGECLAPLVPGLNCRVRVGGHMVRTTCGCCGAVSRRPYIREQSHEREGRQEGAYQARERARPHREGRQGGARPGAVRRGLGAAQEEPPDQGEGPVQLRRRGEGGGRRHSRGHGLRGRRRARRRHDPHGQEDLDLPVPEEVPRRPGCSTSTLSETSPT